jgi:Coenzyme PQQ synthesis protein D (PqqD)
VEADTLGVTGPLADPVPARRAAVSTVPLDDNVALYDDVGQLLILLNRTAAAVWERCDGVATLGDVVDSLARAHAETLGTVHDDVVATVRKLCDLGLLSVGELPAPS